MTGRALTINDVRAMKRESRPIAVLTAYEALFAELLDEAGVDIILVGDSLGNVFQGRSTTIPVTLDEMIYHGEIVARAVKRAFVIVDMPFMSFQVGPDDAVRNAGAVMKKTNCKAVKLEGGVSTMPTIARIVGAGIPVMGHVGLTPQSVHAFGGYGVRGRQDRQAVIDDAKAVEDAGAFAVVLEKMPADLAGEITESIAIPTIGIGAGPRCDGQVLVTQDMLGLFRDFKPAFARRYAELADMCIEVFGRYVEDVRSGDFPSRDESYS